MADNQRSCSTGFHDLTFEMLEKIFLYLNLKDLNNTSLVCKWWYEVSNNSHVLWNNMKNKYGFYPVKNKSELPMSKTFIQHYFKTNNTKDNLLCTINSYNQFLGHMGQTKYDFFITGMIFHHLEIGLYDSHCIEIKQQPDIVRINEYLVVVVIDKHDGTVDIYKSSNLELFKEINIDIKIIHNIWLHGNFIFINSFNQVYVYFLDKYLYTLIISNKSYATVTKEKKEINVNYVPIVNFSFYKSNFAIWLHYIDYPFISIYHLHSGQSLCHIPTEIMTSQINIDIDEVKFLDNKSVVFDLGLHVPPYRVLVLDFNIELKDDSIIECSEIINTHLPDNSIKTSERWRVDLESTTCNIDFDDNYLVLCVRHKCYSLQFLVFDKLTGLPIVNINNIINYHLHLFRLYTKPKLFFTQNHLLCVTGESREPIEVFNISSGIKEDISNVDLRASIPFNETIRFDDKQADSNFCMLKIFNLISCKKHLIKIFNCSSMIEYFVHPEYDFIMFAYNYKDCFYLKKLQFH